MGESCNTCLFAASNSYSLVTLYPHLHTRTLHVSADMVIVMCSNCRLMETAVLPLSVVSSVH
jgi:hypothetical protein